MTVIRPNSISGINSITGQGGDINLFRADGTKADIPTVNNITAGVVTATTFSGNITGSGANLTNLPAANLTGTLPAISGANLTNLPVLPSDINNLINNVAMLGFKVAVNGSLAKYNLVDQVVDEYNDATGIDAAASTNESVGGTGTAKYYFGGSASSSNTTQTYAYSGSDTTLSLNSGQTVTGTVKLWAAAGGTDSSPSGVGHYGGGGAFASATFSFTSDGTNLIFSVGQGGLVGQKGGSGGNGGGYSGVFLGSKTHGNTLIIVGGGGGAGDSASAYAGAGGAFGGNGGDGQGSNGGKGGQQGAGGAVGSTNGSVNATAGAALSGGAGGANEARQQSQSYNGGGIQGQEPGGYLGGGGGGGGYYGGGGGDGGNNGEAGGGGSSFYNTGSYWSGTPSSTAGNGATSGGASDSNYPGGGVGTGSNGSAASGGNGAIYVNINVSSTTPADLTLQSVDATAQSVPSTADLVMLIENGAGTATLNTDIKGFISRDSGANFTQGTLVDEGTWGTTAKRIVAFHNLDISGQPSGTSVCYKITTHNQSGSKSTYIHAASHGWK